MALTSPPRGFHQGDLLLVVHDFTARGPDELTLRRGDKIELVELDDGFGDGWFLGKDLESGVTGLFPGVYTTRAPNIPLRHRTDDLEPDESKSNGFGEKGAGPETLSKELGESPVSPKSEDSTPHASRHASLTDLRAGQETGEPGAPFISPKQPQQRSSSSPLPASKMAIDIQQSVRQSLDPHINGQDSPVMNETLSVIDEHITDLSTPRHSVNAHDTKTINDSASEYSSHLEHRMSYINGHETDEEEGNQQSEGQVRGWGPVETAKQLRQLGIEESHCVIFEEQEISGDVLLDMNQDFIFMKEFDFGVMGRRLKTWHKIKAFQEQLKGLKEKETSSAGGSAAGFRTAPEERSLSRAGQTGPLRPRIPSHRGSFGSVQHPRLISSTMQSNTSSPITPQTPPFMDHTRRPSAASIREINHSRRHSSIDATSRYSTTADSPRIGSLHHKRGSFDRGWTMSNNVQQRAPPRPGTALGASSIDASLTQHTNGGLDSAIAVADELDRGYFSGPEVDTRAQRRFLHKRVPTSGSAHSVHSNLTDEQLRSNRRRSRMSSVESITHMPPNGLHSGVTHPLPSSKGRFRSLSTRRAADRHGQQSSRTTTGTTEKSSGGGFFSALAHFGGRSDAKPDADGSRSTAMPLQQIKNARPKFRRAVGLRAMSDVIGKGVDTSVAPASPVRDFDPSTRTGSTTPSTSKSSERHSTDGSGKAVDAGISFPRARPSMKSGPKSKKDTSAYTRGLEKKSPLEQIPGCDYSGWMKKRSSNIMTTWKPRLFVLRGRRLSYYYSEEDTEERGLIDITAHRVMRADNDPIVALHAAVTGATVSPTSPVGSNNGEGSISEKGSTLEASRGPRTGGDGSFFFKLVPPKTGTSRTVQFTKPAIHYFQVDSVEEGRLWMAALMKATIERDMNLPVETTNKQRTISLKEARQMNQRPPALMVDTENTEEESIDKPIASADEETLGLMIQGLNIDQIASGDITGEPKRSSHPAGGIDSGLSSILPDPVRKSG